MRNGDFIPSRLQAQQDAVNMVCHSKTRSNPENNVGLLTLAKYIFNNFTAILLQNQYILQNFLALRYWLH